MRTDQRRRKRRTRGRRTKREAKRMRRGEKTWEKKTIQRTEAPVGRESKDMKTMSEGTRPNDIHHTATQRHRDTQQYEHDLALVTGHSLFRSFFAFHSMLQTHYTLSCTTTHSTYPKTHTTSSHLVSTPGPGAHTDSELPMILFLSVPLSVFVIESLLMPHSEYEYEYEFPY